MARAGLPLFPTMPLPPHRAIELPGLHAYASDVSVAAGDAIGFHASSSVPYRFSVHRLGPEPDNAAADPLIHDGGAFAASVQPIHPGSYVRVERGLDADLPLSGLSIDLWVRPWDHGRQQVIASQFNATEGHGFTLGLDAKGQLTWRVGTHAVIGPALDMRRWTHLVAVFEAQTLTLWRDGQRVASGTGPAWLLPPPGPLCLGAMATPAGADHFLDADIASPALYQRGLTERDIRHRHALRGLDRVDDAALLAHWPLTEERGEQIADVSAHARHGQIINHATWMIGGPSFDGAQVPRFSAREGDYDPAQDPTRGHGLRLASDDLVDCRWRETQRVTIPRTAAPGLYVGRFSCDIDGRPIRYDVTFVVRRAQDAPRAHVLVLCATNSWRAYASSPFAANVSGPAQWPRRAAPLPNSHPEAPAYNHYTPHRAGQPTYYAGLRMPWPSAASDALYAPEGAGFSHGPRLERCLHQWLEAQGYRFDVVADLDLHRDPAMLEHYACVVINGHSEYWSGPAMDGVDRYLRKGGNAIVLSGNTMYWRVSFNDDGTVMEQRKTLTPTAPDDGTAEKHAAPGGLHGEQYHSHDGQRGGLWRFNDRSCSEVIGLETAGWAFADPEDFGVYRVHQPDHFLFHHPHETGLGPGDTFGHGPDQSLPRAIGHEWDVTIATLRRMTKHVPPGAQLPPEAAGIQVLAQGVRRIPGRLDAYLDFFEGATESLNGLSAEMIYWERPQGGRVFNAGAVGASWVLGVDPQMGALLKNVLHHFGVDSE